MAVIALSHDNVVCGDRVFGHFFSSLWHIGSKFFTIATIDGPVILTFRGHREFTSGPCSGVRLVGQHVFHGDERLACIEQEKWKCSKDNGTYDLIVVSDA